ncbi:MAG: Iron-sulfur flavoprotein [Candidatus Methanocomedens sp.]|nr:MAG: Iron-sulfur flavoprotein [ANME-2 cluster archaeon]
MKILALIGSPRKEGNTDILVDAVLSGAKANGHHGEKLYLYDLNLLPCIDCRNCKNGDMVCTRDDDMRDIYPKIEGADVILFGTPLYWYGPSGPMKLLMDRLLPYSETGMLKGKRAVLVIPSAEGADACEPVVTMFRLSLDYLGVDIAEVLLPTAYEKGEISSNTEEIERARGIGAAL